MADEPLDPATFDLSSLWILVRDTPSRTFSPDDVHRIGAPGSAGPDTVLLFRSAPRGHGRAAELARRGAAVQMHSLGTADEWTDLLSRLKDMGVSYVAVDPVGAGFTRHPIDRVIIGLQLAG